MPLIGNVLKPLANSVLIPLKLTAAASATDAAIYKKNMLCVTTLIISNDGIDDIIKIVKSLEESGVNQTIKNEANLLTVKRAIETSQGREANMPGWGRIRGGECTVRAVMRPHPLPNFEIQ